MPHLLSMKDLDRQTIENLLNRADQLLHDIVKKEKKLDTLAGVVAANLFFEPSTRTQFSFSIAAHRLGAFVLNPLINHTSTVKGESLLDTLRTFIAMGSRLIVMRHKEDYIVENLASEIHDSACLINGGDGCHQHPSQALLDLLTIRQHKGDFAHLKVAIIGDIAHSRVVRSLVQGLTTMGCRQIAVIAPLEFFPADISKWPVTPYTSITEGMSNADVVITLRIQLERISLPPSSPSPAQFLEKFRLTSENLQLTKPDAIVMHPAPINREIEISSEVADGPQSVIFQQISNGVAMRMAIIEWLMS